jgi:hypothetical protein
VQARGKCVKLPRAVHSYTSISMHTPCRCNPPSHALVPRVPSTRHLLQQQFNNSTSVHDLPYLTQRSAHLSSTGGSAAVSKVHTQPVCFVPIFVPRALFRLVFDMGTGGDLRQPFIDPQASAPPAPSAYPAAWQPPPSASSFLGPAPAMAPPQPVGAAGGQQQAHAATCSSGSCCAWGTMLARLCMSDIRLLFVLLMCVCSS